MQILDHTDEHQPTFMRDIIANLIGEYVMVFLDGGQNPLGGKLQAYNVSVMHLTNENGSKNTYIPGNKIIAICADK